LTPVSGIGSDLAARVGAERVIAPAGSLPQQAERLDASGPCRPHETEVRVERLCLDSTSHRQIRDEARGDADAMAERILAIVAERGKLHNPATDSGGVLLGRVTEAGEGVSDPPGEGLRVVTLASLTLTPLRLDAVTGLDPDSAQVDVEGTAYVFDRAPWAPLPGDLAVAAALDLFDVCAAASHVRELAPGTRSVNVLGAGHAGSLALAAARDTAPEATLTVVDVDSGAVERMTGAGLADVGVAADLRDPVAAFEALRAGGAEPADLTVVVVNSTGCEAAAILMTSDAGTVLFFSMATSFSAVALTSDGLSSKARMVVGTGYAPDRGAYALDLVRRTPALAEAMGAGNGAPA
jgi:L-erythro-3,5-diaminohexanoate dehydrogenase